MARTLLSRRDFIAAMSATLATAGNAWAGLLSSLEVERIRRVAIHPAIGVARVGNSRDAFHFGPEVPGTLPDGPFTGVPSRSGSSSSSSRRQKSASS